MLDQGATTFWETMGGWHTFEKAGNRHGSCRLPAKRSGLCFFVAMFLRAIIPLIPGCATAAVLLHVGLLRMGSIQNTD